MIRAAALLFTLGALVSGNAAYGEDACLPCHRQKTPGIVAYWEASVHAARKIGCVSCHGSDVEANHARRVFVDAGRCGSCHAKALATHRASKHAIGLRAGAACTRNLAPTEEQQRSCSLCHRAGSSAPVVSTQCAMFLAQTPEIQRQGCGSCHRVEVSCDSCHTRHGTDLAQAADPGTCGVCHMGPDHPQLEMWETSAHGVLFRRKGEAAAPSCVTCHMAQGSHDVSRGISSPVSRELTTLRRQERDHMLSRCAACHTRAFAARSLEDADRIADQAGQAVAEAQGIVADLQRDGLLLPAPAVRPPHPLLGRAFASGPHMLYENLSTPESKFFQLKQFFAPTAFKGALHQNPDYTHWYGNAPMKLMLSELRSDAAVLRKIDSIGKRLENAVRAGGGGAQQEAGLQQELRTLRDRYLKGELSAEDYGRQKDRVLDSHGL